MVYLYIAAEPYWRRSEVARNLGSAGAVSYNPSERSPRLRTTRVFGFTPTPYPGGKRLI